MIDPRSIMDKVNSRVNLILTVAEAALPHENFQAFRKIVLDQFGRNGLAQDIDALCYGASGTERHGTGRKHPGMKGGSR